jgi:hypothetical protein
MAGACENKTELRQKTEMTKTVSRDILMRNRLTVLKKGCKETLLWSKGVRNSWYRQLLADRVAPL